MKSRVMNHPSIIFSMSVFLIQLMIIDLALAEDAPSAPVPAPASSGASNAGSSNSTNGSDSKVSATVNKKGEKKIKIDFGGDELIQGDFERPDFDMINSPKGQGFKKMIKVRDKFVDEIEKTRDDFNAK